MSVKSDVAGAFPIILVGGLLLLLSCYLVPTGLVTLLVAIWMIFTGLGGFGLCVIRMSVLYGVGLVVIAFAFVSSLIPSYIVLMDFRTAIILKYNPGYSVEIMKNIFLFGLLPLTASLALFVSAHLRGLKIPFGRIGERFFIVSGVFFTVWGIYCLQSTLHSHSTTLQEAQLLNVSHLNYSLSTIYGTYSLVCVLWLIIGIFHLAKSAHKTLRRQ